jgi:hypothetical protein
LKQTFSVTLKNNARRKQLPEAYMFTGCKRVTYDAWPEENTEKQDFTSQGSKLSRQDNAILHLKSL